jgi:hypothetical protein
MLTRKDERSSELQINFFLALLHVQNCRKNIVTQHVKLGLEVPERFDEKKKVTSVGCHTIWSSDLDIAISER